MAEKNTHLPVNNPSVADVFEGLSLPLRINYLVAMASNLSPTDKVRDAQHPQTSIQELRAIGLLNRLGPQSASSLARVSLQDRANVSRTIKKLVENDLVVKLDNPDNKRSPLICATDKAIELYKNLEPQLISKADQYVEDFTEEERESLIKLLERYIANARQ